MCLPVKMKRMSELMLFKSIIGPLSKNTNTFSPCKTWTMQPIDFLLLESDLVYLF